jgi:hypothetical protein
MEQSLRDLIQAKPSEEFRGIYVSNGVKATRRSVLAPGSIGIYSAGSNYNPAQIVRDGFNKSKTFKIDANLSKIQDKGYLELPISEIKKLILLTEADEKYSEYVWNPIAIAESVEQLAKLLKQNTGYVYVDRDRDLDATRHETAGVLSGGEYRNAPTDKVVLYMLRTRQTRSKHAAWWPQVRLPDGSYAFAFAV